MFDWKQAGLRDLVCGAVCALGFLGPAAGAEENGALVRRGQVIVTRDCGVCHAVGRSGASRHREAPPFRTLGRRYPIESLDEALGEGIVSGHPDMPEFKFDPGDVGAIIAYLKSIQEQ
jgi:cytochrome c